jgi:hypothetical protein
VTSHGGSGADILTHRGCASGRVAKHALHLRNCCSRGGATGHRLSGRCLALQGLNRPADNRGNGADSRPGDTAPPKDAGQYRYAADQVGKDTT